MRARNSHDKPQRSGSETLWNTAAVFGLLLIGVVLGGFLGILLDRQGLFGEPRGADVEAALPAPPGNPASQDPVSSPAHRHGENRADVSGLTAQIEEFDREALEAAFQDATEDDSAPQSGPVGTREEIVEFLPAIPIPDRGLTGPAPWQAHAVAVGAAEGRPLVAIVLDDVGVNRRNAGAAIDLPGPLTLSFMTYAQDLDGMTETARAAGHELMLHVPMQPLSPIIDPGPNVLIDSLPAAELTQRLVWGLERFEGYVGINNHMGSRFTASPEGMAVVMGELRARGLLYLDSLTARSSVAGRMAERAGVPFAERDVFLDNEPHDRTAIDRQLALLEGIARERGYAVGIGHPHPATVAALRDWIPEMQARGYALVPISAVVRYRQSLAGRFPSEG